ncbi:Cyp314a1 family protein [Megaselia abdita]
MVALILIWLTILLVIFMNYNSEKFKYSCKKIIATKTKKLSKKRTIWDIPGPRPIPFLGTKWIFYLQKFSLSKLHEAYDEFNKKYGPIVLEVTTSGTPIVHLFDRNDIDTVLKYPSKYPYRPPTDIIVMYRQSRPDRYSSVGITNEQGETWFKLRSRLTSHITSPRILQNFLPILNVIFDDFIDVLKTKRDPSTFCVENFQDVANLMSLEAVCTLMLGRRMGFLGKNLKEEDKVMKLAAAVKQLFISQRDSYYGLGLWKYIPTKTFRDFAKSEEIIYDIISELVDETLAENELNSADDDVNSIFHSILQTKDLDIRDKKSAIIDFIAAGIETLGNTLIFAINFIANHEEAPQRIVEEFGAFKSSYILQDALTKALYTKSCLQETYRLQPTAFCLARFLEEDTTLSNYDLKAGTVLLCQTMIACRNEQNFPDAKTYKPERWISEDKTSNIQLENSSIIVPFGIGKRTCPGKRFVEMELVLLLAKVKFKIL